MGHVHQTGPSRKIMENYGLKLVPAGGGYVIVPRNPAVEIRFD